MTFDRFELPSPLVKVLERRGISMPLPIQEAVLPDALAGRDVCGKAPTGSGKTLAFALPLAAKLERGRPGRPRGLVLAPTRELASQIAAELTSLARTRGLRVHAFYGGVGFGDQLRALRRGVDVAVACPGRLTDLVRSKHVDLGDADMVVVDEADRMADMGFLPDVRRLLDATSPQRQTLLFSATLDGAVDVLVRHYQRNPVRHEVESDESEVARMVHRVHHVSPADRPARCAEIVGSEGTSVVFVRTRHGADRLALQLERQGVSAAAIHGDRSQAQRDRALAAFRSGKVRALVATDVAARGIHVNAVDCVVHYDPPSDPKDYVHRSGRTARAGASGTVVTLVTPEQRRAVQALWQSLDISPQLVGEAPSPEVQVGAVDKTSQHRRSDLPARGRPAPPHRRRSPGGKGPSARVGRGSTDRRKGTGKSDRAGSRNGGR